MAFTPQLRRIMRLNFLGLCRAACLISTRSVGDDGDSLRLTTHSATRHERLTFQAELRRYAHPVSTSLAKCLCLRRSGRIARVKTQFGRLNTLKINSLLKFVRRTNIFVLLNMRISPWALPPLTWTAGKPAVFFYFFFPSAGWRICAGSVAQCGHYATAG